MKLVILGAGASYDSIREEMADFKGQALRPPLANQLFQFTPAYRDLLRNYTGAEALYSELSSVDDVELFLQSQWDHAIATHDNHTLACLINTQYYLQALLHKCTEQYAHSGASNYDVLVNHAHRYSSRKREAVMFVTFNYDTLLERAVVRVLNPRAGYLEHLSCIDSPLKVIKPHGSSNWFRVFKNGMLPDRTTRSNSRVSVYLHESGWDLTRIEQALLPDPIALPGFTESTELDGVVRELYPMLLIPMRSKDAFVMPKPHVQAMREHLSRTSEVLVIGWKAQEDSFNKELVKSLANHDVKITVVCGEGGDEVALVLKTLLPNADVNTFLGNSRAKEGDKQYGVGTFSSYTMKSIRDREQDFFA